MKFKSYIFTKEKKNCTGCGACACICSHMALTMQEDEEGFYYPFLNREKCVHCGLCDVICPVMSNSHQANEYLNEKSYLVTSKSPEYGLNSATIGLCTWIGQWYILHGGYVFGVVLDEEDWKAKYVCVHDLVTLEKTRNSKYLQSNASETYGEVKKMLLAKEQVLYIGTPCQIAGLKSFLRKSYENLLTIDIICHGVFSSKLMPLEVAYWENKFQGRLSNFRFRSKRIYPWSLGGVVNFDITDSEGRKKHVERHAKASPTYRSFAYSGDGKNYNIRESCYDCPFRDKGRYGDLTVGDAWGHAARYKRLFNINNRKNGISSLLCNTGKGKKIVDLLSDEFILTPVLASETFSQDALLPANRLIPPERYTIYQNPESLSYVDLVESVLHVDLEQIYRSFKRDYLRTRIKQFVKERILNLKCLLLIY